MRSSRRMSSLERVGCDLLILNSSRICSLQHLQYSLPLLLARFGQDREQVVGELRKRPEVAV